MTIPIEEAERKEHAKKAEKIGMSLSEYVRRKLRVD